MSYKPKNWHGIYFFTYIMQVGSYDSLSIEKILTLHDAIILIKLVLDKDKSCYYYYYYYYYYY